MTAPLFPQLTEATLIRRYKRFLADVELESGEVVTIYCPNTGAMRSCSMPGMKVWFSTSNNTKRKYPYTWELYRDPNGFHVAVNTLRANQIVEQAIQSKRIVDFQNVKSVRREVSIASFLGEFGRNSNSRIDFLLDANDQTTFVEVKSVTYLEEDSGYFPDAQTLRGQKHLQDLIRLKQKGYRAVLLFCVMHEGIQQVKPAAHVDPDYAKLYDEAKEQGVEFLSYKCKFSQSDLKIDV